MVPEDEMGQEIENLAKQAARELLDAMPNLKAADPIERSMAITKAFGTKQSISAKLKAAFADDISFGDLRSGWIQQHRFMGMVVQNHMIPHLLINSVIDGCPIKSFIADAREFAVARTCTTELYTVLAGVTVTESVPLCDNIDLLPWTDVPDSTQKTSFSPQNVDELEPHSMRTLHPMRAVANSALRVRLPPFQALFATYEDAQKEADKLHRKEIKRTAQLEDILRFVTVLYACPVAALGSWLRFENRAADSIVGTGYTYYGSLFDRAVIRAAIRPIPVDGALIARLCDLFERFRGAGKKVIRISVDRLNQAIGRQDLVGKAIDLGIALEVLLLHGIDEKDRGELRFRSSIRGATFLGGDKPEKLKTFKLLRDTYDLRSRSVHSGVLRMKKGDEPPEEILKIAAGACAKIARKLIERGSFPDWEVEYVIGGESSAPAASGS